jgi:uncharacterized protein (TIGR00255 family)
MTGFGQADENGYHIEVKGVNHRYRDIRVRLPKDLSALEIPVRDLVNEQIARGKVELSVSRIVSSDVQERLSINWDLARTYFNDLVQMVQHFGGEVNFRDILMLPGVMSESIRDAEEQWTLVRKGIKVALDSFIRMKTDEGRRLKDDICARTEYLDSLREKMKASSQDMVQLYRDRLVMRLNELLESKADMVDKTRLEQEVALIADRTDITEELVRLHSHIVSFREAVASPEPSIGRRLDFILQEINRELNTIGSKSQDAALSHDVIDAKAEVEKIREQVQNIE